ncbi:hypothetical protein FBUS_04975 [Fasciolopsis buskii]|uniref:Uncharacterized protein n=1 Tax=Fasciolopsis buskii TaxID=27845 RepID=A0A8E0VKI9_9TREM|nr:hypothetical protein FBUS_04975 [Fasciolopsis buski]
MIGLCLALSALMICSQAQLYNVPGDDLFDYDDDASALYSPQLMHRDRRFLLGMGMPGPRRKFHRTRRSEDDLEGDYEDGDVQKRFLLGLPARTLQRHNRKRFLLGLPARTRMA